MVMKSANQLLINEDDALMEVTRHFANIFHDSKKVVKGIM